MANRKQWQIENKRAALMEPEPPRLMMRLDDVLKRAGLVGTGGQAKIWIQDGQVSVNGEVETRRRKQLFLGDIVETMGEQVTLDQSFFES